MPRELSLGFIRVLNDSESPEHDLVFIKISHRLLTSPILAVNDLTPNVNGKPADYIFDGKTWKAYPFSLAYPTDSDEIAQTRLSIQNVDRRQGGSVRSIPADEPLSLALAVYSSEEFEFSSGAMRAIGAPTLQYSWQNTFIRDVKWNQDSMSGAVMGIDFSREPWPCLRNTPNIAPGLSIT